MADAQKIEESFQTLRNDDLFAIARNRSAAHRELAIRMLIKRASPYVGHEEIRDEANAIVINDPRILREVDPASLIACHRLPGIFEILHNINQNHASLSQTTASNHAALESTVKKHHEALSHSLSEESEQRKQASADHARALSEQASAHTAEISCLSEKTTQQAEELRKALQDQAEKHERALHEHATKNSEALDQQAKTHADELTNQAAAHGNGIAELKQRLALLERSLWRKAVDFIKSLFVRKTDK